MTRRFRTIAVVAAVIVGLAPTWAVAQQAGKKEHEFRGKIEKVDTKAQKLTVNGEKVEGWMAAMTMDYKVDKAATLSTVKAGDQITAKVYDGNFDTLFDVTIVPPKDNKRPAER